MEQRVSLITLGVSDLSRAVTFYERLGWHGQQVEETVFFQLGGLGLVLWGHDRLADDVGLDRSQTTGFRGVALAHNVRERPQVDAVMAESETAGGTVVQPPAETFYGGYAGCFADPDGHVWEVAYNPGFPLNDDGSLTLPDFGAAHDDEAAHWGHAPDGSARTPGSH